jgi:hypothetical protein
MRNITLLSMFNNATGYLPRYFAQVVALRDELDETNAGSLHLILVEGDSTDATWHELQRGMTEHGLSGKLWQHHHGQPLRRGTGHPDRLANLSRIWNPMLDAVPESADMVVIVESDLVWEPATMLELLWRSEDGNIHCPMVWLGNIFYDTFLYRRHGQCFTNSLPYHPDLVMGEPLELDSAGSCLVMPGRVARQHRTTEREELMGLCHSARARGCKVILDSDLSIQQPRAQWVGAKPLEAVV